MKTHRFLVTVKTAGSKVTAHSALLLAFGVREPDGCEFHLSRCGQKTFLTADARAEIRELAKQNRKQARIISRYARIAKKMNQVSQS